ncbi:MAG: hypothetical protein BWY86_01067 [Candidatus Aminicenantes bacterium ADurb.Bin508]|nr:MAG: hypothetical protein BWY86_01067 [Candidatus Aminicenantes bacterium ADurb.Bin508]
MSGARETYWEGSPEESWEENRRTRVNPSLPSKNSCLTNLKASASWRLRRRLKASFKVTPPSLAPRVGATFTKRADRFLITCSGKEESSASTSLSLSPP